MKLIKEGNGKMIRLYMCIKSFMDFDYKVGDIITGVTYNAFMSRGTEKEWLETMFKDLGYVVAYELEDNEAEVDIPSL